MDVKKALKKVAKKHGITLQELKSDIEEAIKNTAAYKKLKKDKKNSVTSTEFINYIVEQIRNY